MTAYKHTCGQRYERMTHTSAPRERMVICGRCFEPMPVCDAKRAAFSYEPVKDVSLFRRLLSAKTAPQPVQPTLKMRAPSRVLPAGRRASA